MKTAERSGAMATETMNPAQPAPTMSVPRIRTGTRAEQNGPQTRRFQHAALRLVITLALSIFLAEAAVMILLALLPPLGTWVTTFLDSATVVLLVSPLLYWFAFRPLVRTLKEREQATAALHQANEHLEARVKDRTANLDLANQRLTAEIAERKKGEAELRRAKEEWERTFDAVPDLISIIDDQHHIVRANRAMVERMALTQRKCVGQVCYEVVHGTVCPPQSCPHRLSLADGREHAAEFHEERLGGDFLVTTTPLQDESGRRVGSVHVARDITQQKRDAEELRRARDELERRVQERTAALQTANDQLRRESAVRQQKEAELARVSRITMASQLSASLAHELNQPLGAVVCNVQAAQQYLTQPSPPMDELRSILTDIEADGKRAGEIIHRLRALFQKTGQKRTPLQLNHVVQETIDLMHSEFAEVSLELALAPALPLVLGNHIELQQVLINLLVNAIEAMATQPPRQAPAASPLLGEMGRGEGELLVRVHGEGELLAHGEISPNHFAHSHRLHLATFSPDPSTVRVALRDSGPGIDLEQLPHLFEPFFTTRATGTGMGLAICHSIIEAHEGRLWVENNPDRGATFHFALPAAPEPAP